MSIRIDNYKEFALAGNATLTLQTDGATKHFTYNIKRCDDKPELYFVRLLSGSDNEEDYRYIGCYYSDTNYFHPSKQYIDVPRYSRPKSMQMFTQFILNLDNIPDTMMVFHEGKCARCGRKLTTPESITTGFGPECRRYI